MIASWSAGGLDAVAVVDGECVAGLALALGGMGISVAIHRAQPDEPPAFYTAPSPLPERPPGTIIRSEVIDDFHAGATGAVQVDRLRRRADGGQRHRHRARRTGARGKDAG